jgi:hypothetical protein
MCMIAQKPSKREKGAGCSENLANLLCLSRMGGPFGVEVNMCHCKVT